MTPDPRSAYRQTSGQSAGPVRRVVLLYEQLADDVRQAIAATERGEAETKALQIGHALEIVGQLQGRLDMERGGEVARNLDRFYDLLRADLLRAQIQSSSSTLQRQLGNLLTLREAWLEVERIESGAAVASPQTPAPPAPAGNKPLDWSA